MRPSRVDPPALDAHIFLNLHAVLPLEGDLRLPRVREGVLIGNRDLLAKGVGIAALQTLGDAQFGDMRYAAGNEPPSGFESSRVEPQPRSLPMAMRGGHKACIGIFGEGVALINEAHQTLILEGHSDQVRVLCNLERLLNKHDARHSRRDAQLRRIPTRVAYVQRHSTLLVESCRVR